MKNLVLMDTKRITVLLFRMMEDAKYIQPDAANFNSWRRHIKLLGDPPDEVVFAWEDVKVRTFFVRAQQASEEGVTCRNGTKYIRYLSSNDTKRLNSFLKYP
jgi:hypothetical protein